MEKVQATVGVYPTSEEAEAKAEEHLNELLEAGHKVERVDVEPTEIGGEKLWAVRSVYYRKTPEEVVADQQAAAAAAAVGAARRSWWRYALGVAPLVVAVGGLILAAVKREPRWEEPRERWQGRM